MQSAEGVRAKSFINIFGEIFNRFPGKQKKQFWLLFVYMLLVSAIAMFTVTSIALFAVTFSSPEKLLDSKYIVAAQNVVQMDFLRSAKGLMVFLSFSMIFLVGMKNILQSLLLYWVARFTADVEAYFGTVLFKGFLHMPYQWHLNRNSADLILALGWRSTIGLGFVNTALKTLSDILLVLFLISILILVNPYISIAVLMMSGITAFLSYNKIHRLQKGKAEKCREYDQSINRRAAKGIHGIKDVKVSGKTSFLMDFKKEAYESARIRGMRNFFGQLPIGLLETIGFAMLSGASLFMLFFIKSSSVEVTAVITLLIVSAWRILPAISRIMAGFISIHNILPYLKVEVDYLKDVESNAVYPSMLDNDSFKGLRFDNEIQLKNIHFAYQDRKTYSS